MVAEPLTQPEGELDTDPYTHVSQLLDDFMRRHKIPRVISYLAMPAEYCILRQFSVPFTADDQIRKTIRFQAEAHITSADIDDLELAYVKTHTGKSSSQVVATAVRQDSLREMINAMRRSGLDPIGIDTPPGAAINGILHQPEAKSEDLIVWVDVGDHYTNLIATQNGELKAVRHTKLGVVLPPDPQAEDAQRQRLAKRRRSSSREMAIDLEALKKASQEDSTAKPGAEPRQQARDIIFEEDNDGEFALPTFLDADGDPILAEDLPEATSPPLDATAYLNVPGTDKLSDAFIRRLVTEVRRTLMTLEVELPVKQIRVTGGGSTGRSSSSSWRRSCRGTRSSCTTWRSGASTGTGSATTSGTTTRRS